MKKVWSLILGTALTATAAIPTYAIADKTYTAVGASGVYINEDFTKPESEMDNDQWSPQGWTFQGVTDIEVERIHPDGYVELKQNYGIASAQIQYLITKKIPDKFTFMYDVYFGADDGRYVYIPSIINGYNLGMNAYGQTSYVDVEGANRSYNTGTPEFDTWYTYVFQVKGTHMDVYRKSEYDEVFEKVADNIRMQTSTAPNTVRIYATNTQRKMSEARLDNVKVVSGTYLIDSDIEINSEKTEITGKMKIGNGDIPMNGSRKLTVIMSAYDSRGKILKMEMDSNKSIKFGEDNEVTMTMAIDEALYEKMKGGTAELYIWDSASGAKPQCDMHVLEVE